MTRVHLWDLSKVHRKVHMQKMFKMLNQVLNQVLNIKDAQGALLSKAYLAGPK